MSKPIATIVALLVSLGSTLAFAQTPTIAVPAVAGEIASEQEVVKAGDDKLSCDAVLSELQTLVAAVKQHEVLAEKLQAEMVDRAGAARDAARNRERAAAQAQADQARIAAKTQIAMPDVKFDPNNPPAQREMPKLDGATITSAAFQPSRAPAVTPTQMRQYRLSRIARDKDCGTPVPGPKPPTDS